jgi:hypothetical protein
MHLLLDERLPKKIWQWPTSPVVEIIVVATQLAGLLLFAALIGVLAAIVI